MNRLSVCVLLATTCVAAAQDMPLHEIVMPGESWQAASGPMPAAGKAHPVPKTVGPLREPTCAGVALGGSTLLVADAADRYVWAFQLQKDGTIGPGDRYCRLRVRGDERRTDRSPAAWFRANPSAITTDAANRTYVATDLGIQVFDPTGRLCGVITAPPGQIRELAFDGDRLYALSGEQVFVRKMLARGMK